VLQHKPGSYPSAVTRGATRAAIRLLHWGGCMAYAVVLCLPPAAKNGQQFASCAGKADAGSSKPLHADPAKYPSAVTRGTKWAAIRLMHWEFWWWVPELCLRTRVLQHQPCSYRSAVTAAQNGQQFDSCAGKADAGSSKLLHAFPAECPSAVTRGKQRAAICIMHKRPSRFSPINTSTGHGLCSPSFIPAACQGLFHTSSDVHTAPASFAV
jgi:hypothetical protein